MLALVNQPTLIEPGMYFTDGRRLYRIADLDLDEHTVDVENCKTTAVYTISIDTIIEGWNEVKAVFNDPVTS